MGSFRTPRSRVIRIGLLILTLAGFGPGAVNCDGSESAVIPQLEKLAKEFPLERWDTDTLATQKVDGVNSISKYTLTGDTTHIYERNMNDKGKDVIVLTSEEDKIRNTKHKRIYVVLKQKKDAEYWITLAFLRPAGPKDTPTSVEMDGRKQAIEWVMFDEHIVPTRPTSTFTVLQCASSFLAPCSFNDKALLPEDKFVKSPHYVAKAVDLGKVDEIEDKLEGDRDHGELFVDLNFRQGTFEGNGRSVGSYDQPQNVYQGGYYQAQPTTQYGAAGYPTTINGQQAEVLHYPSGNGQEEGVGVLGGTLTSVGGVVCGIVSIIASCADERAYNNQMPIGMAAKEGWNKNDAFGASNYVGKRKKRSSELEKILDYPGWRTQFATPKPGIVGEKDTLGIFYGLGNCPYEPVDPKKFEGSGNDIIDAYLSVLRIQCVDWMKEFAQKLYKEKYINPHNKVLEADASSPVYHQPKLNLQEMLLIASASELDAVSKAYVAEQASPSSTKSPDGKLDITRSIAFLTNVALTAIQRFSEYSPQHDIFLSRHLLQTYKAIFSKLRQDLQNLSTCTDCAKDLAIYWGDRHQIMAIIEYIKFGGDGSRADFDSFYKKNLDNIEKLVTLYS